MSVHVVSKMEVYVVGVEGTIVYWNGTKWETQSSFINRVL